MGVDFDTDDMYANTAVNNAAYWWDLTGLTDFPEEALVGDWGIDTSTGDVSELTA
jgi:hypothetical protein